MTQFRDRDTVLSEVRYYIKHGFMPSASLQARSWARTLAEEAKAREIAEAKLEAILGWLYAESGLGCDFFPSMFLDGGEDRAEADDIFLKKAGYQES